MRGTSRLRALAIAASVVLFVGVAAGAWLAKSDSASRMLAVDVARHIAAVEVLLHADLPTAQGQSVGRYGFLEPCEGAVMLRTRTDSIEWYAGLLAGLPFDFEIRKPAEMQEAMRKIAARALACSYTKCSLAKRLREGQSRCPTRARVLP